ncbi:hypothetical protein F4774DRAFT_417354 [Daldinia eschscholtzii]|nr:hypothetical protein F4774DRAFT_417354 [Daldinia eschscholtzii]
MAAEIQQQQQPQQPRLRFGDGLNEAVDYTVNDNSRDEELGITWTDADQAMVRARVGLRYLPKFWKMMLHIYKRSPSDLFTWALRIGDDEDELIRDLCEIIPHEIWKADLTLLRHCLQMAIYFRVKNHALPFSFFKTGFVQPILNLERHLLDANVPEPEARLARHAYAAWEATATDMNMSVAPFLWELEKLTQGKEVIGTAEEEKFFVLQKVDIFNVRKALDILCDKGLYRCSVDMRYVLYIRTYSDQWPLLQPYTQEMLQELEKIAVLSRRRARAMGLPDIPSGRSQVYSRIPYWKTHKNGDKRYGEAMFQYGDLWTVGCAQQVQEPIREPVREQPDHEEAAEEVVEEMEAMDDL